MKAQITALELIAVLIALFIAVGILFPQLIYHNRWNDANLLIKSRDLILTADRLGILQKSSFNQTAFQIFANGATTIKNIIFFSTVQGTFKQRVVVACVCTPAQIGDLTNWIGTFVVNSRTVSLDFIPASLDKIPASDVLFIYGGPQPLEPFKQNLKNYLQTGSGIVLMANIKKTEITSVHEEVFGITSCAAASGCGDPSVTDDSINVPLTATDPFYQQYKIFYHLPLPLSGVDATTVPSGCVSPSPKQGNFVFRGNTYAFWICGDFVYFNTGQLQNPYLNVQPRTTFQLGGYSFFLNYVKPNFIHISFEPTSPYNFVDFLRDAQNNQVRLAPLNGENQRVFIQAGTYSGGPAYPIPVVVVNGTAAKTAWVADFTSSGVGDDEKLLLGSLILASTNIKRVDQTFTNLRTGLLTNYVNVINYDLYEVYRFNLGAGFPF